MKKAIPLFKMVLVVTFIVTGFVICSIFTYTGSQKSEKIPDAELSDIGSDNETVITGFLSDQNVEYMKRLKISDRTVSSFDYNSQMDLNDIAIYNGIISEISVSPTLVTYDYNHDGVVDIKKTILFFNIG